MKQKANPYTSESEYQIQWCYFVSSLFNQCSLSIIIDFLELETVQNFGWNPTLWFMYYTIDLNMNILVQVSSPIQWCLDIITNHSWRACKRSLKV